VDVSLEELADILGEELSLPRIQPRARETIETTKWKLKGIQPAGPMGLTHKKRTYLRALKRTIGEGKWRPGQPLSVIPERCDRRFKAFEPTTLPRTNAAIFYLMDVSGSMGEQEKRIVRTTSFWLDTWIRRHYRGIESIYIIHDAEARRVDRHTFFRTTESGGTQISSAYRLAAELIRKDYRPEDWNLYVFHFSDGENWAGDNEVCIELLRERLLPAVNLFGYGETFGEHRTTDGAEFAEFLTNNLQDPKAAVTRIHGMQGVLPALKSLLGKA
jgi:uncharacterized sporulation protein YeaH/YhbH (DUF444 family)